MPTTSHTITMYGSPGSSQQGVLRILAVCTLKLHPIITNES
jgi:hypothetical protein